MESHPPRENYDNQLAIMRGQRFGVVGTDQTSNYLRAFSEEQSETITLTFEDEVPVLDFYEELDIDRLKQLGASIMNFVRDTIKGK